MSEVVPDLIKRLKADVARDFNLKPVGVSQIGGGVLRGLVDIQEVIPTLNSDIKSSETKFRGLILTINCDAFS